MSIKSVRLNTGVEAPEPLVRVAMVTLDALLKEEGVVFFELVTKARNPDHRFFGNTGARLQDLALLDHRGHVHDAVRDIILAAVTGEGLGMTLGSPLASESPARDTP